MLGQLRFDPLDQITAGKRVQLHPVRLEEGDLLFGGAIGPQGLDDLAADLVRGGEYPLADLVVDPLARQPAGFDIREPEPEVDSAFAVPGIAAGVAGESPAMLKPTRSKSRMQ